jgi:ABC-type polar amino acid transport system ATPase subunit
MIFVDNIYKKENDNIILNNVSLQLTKGDNYIFAGPSGSGRSTFFKTLCNIEKIQKGSIQINNKDISLYSKQELAQTIGMVFQEPGLFENFNILKNLTYPQIHVLGIKQKQAQDNALQILSEFNIENIQNKMPLELSKGLAKKASILRVLLLNPKFLILDEPMLFLDPLMAHELIEAILKLQSKNITTLISSNSKNVSRTLGNKIIFFNKGVIEETNNVEDFFQHPKTDIVKNFLRKFKTEANRNH